jgi:hypothetical protein
MAMRNPWTLVSDALHVRVRSKLDAARGLQKKGLASQWVV